MAKYVSFTSKHVPSFEEALQYLRGVQRLYRRCNADESLYAADVIKTCIYDLKHLYEKGELPNAKKRRLRMEDK